MLHVEVVHRDVLEVLLKRFLTALICELEHPILPLLLAHAWVLCNRIAIFVVHLLLRLFCRLFSFLLQDGVIHVSQHAVPHAVSLVVHVVDTVAVDFGTSVDNLAGSDPLFVLFLLADELFDIDHIGEVVHLKGIFGVDFLSKMGKWMLASLYLRALLGSLTF